MSLSAEMTGDKELSLSSEMSGDKERPLPLSPRIHRKERDQTCGGICRRAWSLFYDTAHERNFPSYGGYGPVREQRAARPPLPC